MPWTNSPTSRRKAQLPDDWPAIRELVLERDGYRCTWTEQDTRPDGVRNKPDHMRHGGKVNQVDHVGDGNDHRLSNLRTLCERHHAVRSAWQSPQVKFPQHRGRNGGEKHPGLL
jgi:5-methylcytosine-specific restriction protein A